MDIEYAKSVLKTEAEAIASLIPKIDRSFAEAVGEILRCRGRVVVTGMGKAGIVGQKISATFSSTGTPSLFLHPAEACHGDLGMVVKEDVVLCLSNSGETDELIRLIPHIRRVGARIVAITSSATSTMAALSDIVLDIGVIGEACPLGLAPSASTTAILALGDALALTVLKERGLKAEDYARFHPGGDLGRRLMKVGEAMRKDDRNPVIGENGSVAEAVAAITRARAGAIGVVDAEGRLTGIFTDGDLRRCIGKGMDVGKRRIGEVMTKNPVTIAPGRLVAEAAAILREKKIDELPVVDAARKPVGMLDIQDLLAGGYI